MTKKKIWNQIAVSLETTLSQAELKTWFAPTVLKKLDKELAVIEAPNKFIATWLSDNYLDQIKKSFYNQLNYLPEIRFIYKGSERFNEKPSYKTQKKSHVTFNKDLDQLFTFSHFVVEKSNRFAFSMALEMANNAAESYTSLYFFGKGSSGKTHLLHAIGNQVYQREPYSTIIYMPFERFAEEYSFSQKKRDLIEFRQNFTNSTLLLIDDIHLVTGRGKLQKEIVSIIDHYYEFKKRIAFAGKLAPGEIQSLLPELRSRLEGGLLSDIKTPDQKTRVKIIKKKAKTEKISLPDDVAFFLANSITDLKTLTNYLGSLGAYTSINKKQINISIVKSVIKNKNKHKINIKQIQKIISDHFNISVTDLLSNKKTHKYSYPRHLAMYITRELTGLSFQDIAKSFGNKDHSTIVYAVKHIDKSKNERKEIMEDLNKLQNLLIFLK